MKWRSALVPVTNIGSNLAMPLVLLGIVLSFDTLAYVGVILFSATAIFQLVTLPVELNASRRALAALEGSGMSRDGLKGAKKVLTAAALTYVAALLTAVLTELWKRWTPLASVRRLWCKPRTAPSLRTKPPQGAFTARCAQGRAHAVYLLRHPISTLRQRNFLSL